MRKDFGRSTNLDERALLGHTWVLGAQAAEDRTIMVDQAQRRLRVTRDTGHHHWSFYVLALAYYRTGQYGEAVDVLRKRLAEAPDHVFNMLNYLVLATSLARLKQKDEARSWLEKARTVMALRKQTRPAGWKRYSTPNIAWFDWVQMHDLEREAAGLLGEKSATTGATAPAGGKQP